MIAKFPIQTLKIFLLSNNDPHRLLTFGYLCFDVGRLPPPPPRATPVEALWLQKEATLTARQSERMRLRT